MPRAQEERVAVVPGSFDPLTNGHVDLVERASRLFDRVIVAILTNTAKQPMFPVSDRVDMARAVFRTQTNITVDAFDGLLVDYARAKGARWLVRGVRGVVDFETETQMALLNRRLEAGVETVFLTPSETTAYLSSRLVREIALLGGSLTGLVPPAVAQRLTASRQLSRRRRA